MSNNYSHVLQKAGILKNFSVAKIVSKKEIDDLKNLIGTVTSDKKEYEKMLEEEMTKISNMHDEKSPIPGIIYIEDSEQIIKQLHDSAKAYATKMNKTKGMTKKKICFLVTLIIKELGLTKEDFLKLNEEDESEDDE